MRKASGRCFVRVVGLDHHDFLSCEAFFLRTISLSTSGEIMFGRFADIMFAPRLNLCVCKPNLLLGTGFKLHFVRSIFGTAARSVSISPNRSNEAGSDVTLEPLKSTEVLSVPLRQFSF